MRQVPRVLLKEVLQVATIVLCQGEDGAGEAGAVLQVGQMHVVGVLGLSKEEKGATDGICLEHHHVDSRCNPWGNPEGVQGVPAPAHAGEKVDDENGRANTGNARLLDGRERHGVEDG
eukprot:10727428-Heterocapsa_arctica.AAC.1